MRGVLSLPWSLVIVQLRVFPTLKLGSDWFCHSSLCFASTDRVHLNYVQLFQTVRDRLFKQYQFVCIYVCILSIFFSHFPRSFTLILCTLPDKLVLKEAYLLFLFLNNLLLEIHHYENTGISFKQAQYVERNSLKRPVSPAIDPVC